MSVTRTLINAEQLPEIAHGKRCELLRGELVEMPPPQKKHSWIVARLIAWMFPFVREGKLGVVGTELGFILQRNPDTVRAPDVYFVSVSRWGDPDADDYFEGAPDLAVEVLSPSDRASEVQEKIREYLAAGCPLVWVVDPGSETVTAYHPGGDAQIYSGNQEVTGEQVLPGFSFRAAELFRA